MTVLEMVKTAARRVSAAHFRLPLESSTPTLRERVYCYELYHQLRCIDPTVTISAEVDKRGHPRLPPDKKKPNPDLIFHVPGSNAANLAVVEVENDGKRRHLKKDFGNFRVMRDQFGYQELILLVYGVKRLNMQSIREELLAAQFTPSDVVVLHHAIAEQSPSVVDLSNS